MSSHSFILPMTGTSSMSLATLQCIYNFVLTIFLLYSSFSNLPRIFQALEVISAVIASSEAWEDWEAEGAADSRVQAYWLQPVPTALA